MAYIIKQRVINTIILDNDDSGLQDSIKVFKKGTVSNLSVRVNITHSYSGDLEISLTAPSGKSSVILSAHIEPARGPGSPIFRRSVVTRARGAEG